MTVKERLHDAVETMSDDEARAALRTLADASGDPVAWMLNHAPLDDEPYTGDDRAASEEGWAAYQRGEAIGIAELRAESDADA
jgi:hypothetical protein